MNDRYGQTENPEARWRRMLAWAREKQLEDAQPVEMPVAQPEPVTA